MEQPANIQGPVCNTAAWTIHALDQGNTTEARSLLETMAHHLSCPDFSVALSGRFSEHVKVGEDWAVKAAVLNILDNNPVTASRIAFSVEIREGVTVPFETVERVLSELRQEGKARQIISRTTGIKLWVATAPHGFAISLAAPQHLSKDAIALDIAGDGAFIRERLAHPEACDNDSFRTIEQPNGHRLVLCCQSGQWRGRSCAVNQLPQARLHPRSEEDMLLREAAQRGIPVVSGQEAGLAIDEQVIEADVRAMIDRALREGVTR